MCINVTMRYVAALSISIILPLIFSFEAQSADVYRVSNIEVEATASSAVRARQAAIFEGHAAALKVLLHRITLPEDWTRLPRLSGKEAQLLAIGYTMAEERNSSTNYIGRISVRFVASRVQNILKENDIPFGDVQSSPTLVVPVYDLPNGRRLVWDNKNVWREAWARPDIGESLTPFILPVGDLDDIVILPARSASVKNRAALFKLAKRYKAKRVLLAHAKLGEVNFKGQKSYALGVKLNVLTDKNNSASDEVMNFAISSNDGPIKLARLGVDDVLRMTGITWKRRIIIHHNEVNEREVGITFRSLLEWQKIRKLLDSISVISEYQVHRLDSKNALLLFNYSGSKEILSLALKQKNLELVFDDDEGEPWQLKLRK